MFKEDTSLFGRTKSHAVVPVRSDKGRCGVGGAPDRGRVTDSRVRV